MSKQSRSSQFDDEDYQQKKSHGKKTEKIKPTESEFEIWEAQKQKTDSRRKTKQKDKNKYHKYDDWN